MYMIYRLQHRFRHYYATVLHTFKCSVLRFFCISFVFRLRFDCISFGFCFRFVSVLFVFRLSGLKAPIRQQTTSFRLAFVCVLF
jgi:hypothetical protein